MVKVPIYPNFPGHDSYLGHNYGDLIRLRDHESVLRAQGGVASPSFAGTAFLRSRIMRASAERAAPLRSRGIRGRG